jgi:archaellum biogenesis ATPase FlaH
MSLQQPPTASDIVQPFKFLSVEELYQVPDEAINYIVSNLLPTSGLSILVGKPKAGKSTLARQLAVSVAQGQEFLKRETEQGVVLYMALEEKLSEIKAHFKALGLTVGENVRTYCDPAMREALPRLEAALQTMPEVKLVIIDPILKFIKVGDSNDYVKVSDAFEPLLKLCRTYDVHIMAVHHMKKRVAEDPMDNTLGSTALAAAVDTLIVLQRDGAGIRTLCSRQRYGKDLEETQLNWDEKKRRLSMGMTCEEAEQKADEKSGERITQEIINYINKHPGCTQEAIYNSVAGKTSTVKAMFRAIADQGLLDQTGQGAKGNPYRYTLREVPMEVVEEPTEV